MVSTVSSAKPCRTTAPEIDETSVKLSAWRHDGSLLLAFKRPWKDGTRALVLSAEDLLVRLCAAVPPPFFNMIRYYGVLSSHSAFRSRVVPVPAQAPGAHTPPPSLGDQLERARAEAEGSLSGVQGPASYAPTLGGSA